MKASAIFVAAIAQVASAHYFMDRNTNAQGVDGGQFKYVRKSTRAVMYNPIKFSSNPAADIRDGSTVDGPDIVCNQGAFSSAGRTEVLTVNAGEEIRLKLAVGATMKHPGPGCVYLAKAPGSVKEFSGIGADWFKIFQEGVCNNGDFTTSAWCTWDRNYIAAKVPKDTPNGEYLARFEHIGVHRSHVNQPEHYVSCLQIKVVNGGNGTPGPLVKFPGAYKATDPYANFSIYNGKKDFPFPGPAVWTGGSSGASKQDTSPAQPASSPTPSPAAAQPANPAAPAPAGPSTMRTMTKSKSKPKPTGCSSSDY